MSDTLLQGGHLLACHVQDHLEIWRRIYPVAESSPTVFFFSVWVLVSPLCPVTLWAEKDTERSASSTKCHMWTKELNTQLCLYGEFLCETALTSWLSTCSCSAASRVAVLIRKSLEVLSFMYCIRFTWTDVCEPLHECSDMLTTSGNFLFKWPFFKCIATHLSSVTSGPAHSYLWLLWECDEIFLILLNAEDQVRDGLCLT